MADRASLPPSLPYQPTTSAETDANASFNSPPATSRTAISPGLAGGEDVATLPPVPVERQPSAAPPPANARAGGATISPQAMGFLVGTMGMPAATAVALYSGKSTENLNAMGAEVESWNLGTRALGALGAVGGAAETIAGGVTLAAGVGASEVAVGIPVAVFGGIVTAHGADTFWAGAETAWTGETADTRTATVLKGIGMPPLAANLTDAGLGIAFSLGSSALMRSPRVIASAVAEPAMAVEAAKNTKNLAATRLQQQSGGRIGVGRDYHGHIKVMVQEAGGEPQWSHLISDWDNAKIELKYTGVPRSDTAIVELPLSAERANAAAVQVRELIDSQTFRGSQFYDLGQIDCLEYGADVLKAGQIATPMTHRVSELLVNVQRDADLLMASADETTAVAAKLAMAENSNIDEVMQLKRAAVDLHMRAVLMMDDYISARSANIYSAVAAQQARLLEIERAYTAALDEATQAYQTAQTALDAANAAHAARARTVHIASTVATGAQSAQAGEDIALADLDPGTVVEIGPSEAEDEI